MKNIVGVVTTMYPSYKLEDALKGISKAGFKYVEITPAPEYFIHIVPNPEELTSKDAQNILDLCTKYSLKIYSVAGHTQLMKDNAVGNFKKVIDAARMFGTSSKRKAKL